LIATSAGAAPAMLVNEESLAGAAGFGSLL